MGSKTKTNKKTNKKASIPQKPLNRTQIKTKERNKKLLLALEIFRKCGVLGTAAKEAQISRKMLTQCIVKYPKFGAKWEEAWEEYLDSLEHIVDERARAYSNDLLKFRLRAARKEVYGNQVNVQNNNYNVENKLTQININPINIVQIAEKMAINLRDEIELNTEVNQPLTTRRKVPTIVEDITNDS